MTKINLLKGNNLETLKKIADNSVDSIVTDPPYGLNFMGKKWDYDVPSIELWKECFRVLKHGGHLLSFGGTRTYHRLVVNIEDAGFEIRDCIQWLYGSGFPKSTDVSKRIDKEAGAEREVLGESENNRDRSKHEYNSVGNVGSAAIITAPSTDSVKQWQGWGTALKPANEPICVARKPLEKGLTVAENVLKYGTGAINIDVCRVSMTDEDRKAVQAKANKKDTTNNIIEGYGNNTATHGDWSMSKGRWPANIILDEVAAELLDAQSGVLKSGSISKDTYANMEGRRTEFHTLGKQYSREVKPFVGDSGGASRFFYVAKASKSERNKGLEGMPLVESGIKNDSGRGFSESDPHKKILNQNFHPTVKPIKLMQYLIKLVTPPNGIVLDPFMGSGSTGVAAKELGFNFVGCELSPEYFEIAEKRINEKG